ncbi:MAG: glucan biosynthesis protein [Paenibacillus sp.]|jgi:tetratricopeptide (TPR) repeat protein|nr:glucan biosynthesis protein [Paenibacillus sp.]
MDQSLLKQLTRWHKHSEHQKIVSALVEIPETERDYDAVCLLARAFNNLDRYEEAVQQLLIVEGQGRQDPLWHFRLGYAYYYLKRYDEAVHAFGDADKLDPGDPDTLNFLTSSRQEAGKQHSQVTRSKRVKPDNASGTGTPVDGDFFGQIDFTRFWDDSDYARKEYVSEPPTDELIASIEEELGYKLPASYIAMMKIHNGGIPVHTCFPTDDATSWAEDHISISGIMGIGREKAYSLCGEFGSPFMIEEWGYPDIGVVICDCPSAGHDVVMLDYRECGRDGEPAVVHVDQEADYNITFLAPNFAAFIQGLVHEDVYDTSEEDKQEDFRKVAAGKFSPLLAELCAKVDEVERIEHVIRTICTQIVEEKGVFALHADERSMLMYDLQFWLYTKSYPQTTRDRYLGVYEQMIAFGGEFSTGGYAPGFITDWLDNRLQQGLIVENDGTLQLTAAATDDLIDRLKAVDIPGSPEQDEESFETVADQIRPFVLVQHDGGNVSMILNVGEYKAELFELRADEGFEGNGYDWGSLAAVFLEEKMPELTGVIRFDPEASMFCAYSSEREAMYRFATGFKQACEDDALIRDLFARAELD